MEKLLQVVMYFSWALWLIYSYVVLFSKRARADRGLLLFTFLALLALIVLLKSRMMIVFSIISLLVILVGMFRKPSQKQTKEAPSPEEVIHSPFFAFFGIALATIVILSLFFLLSRDFKSESNYFIERYDFKIDPSKKEIIIGNSKEDSDITIVNNASDKAHLRLVLGENNFFAQNISQVKKVDINGRYLNKLVLKQGDEIEIMGRDKIKLLKIDKQYPLGRSMLVSIKRPGQKEEKTLTLHTLLNKPFIIQYQDVRKLISGFNKLLIPGRTEKPAAAISYETNRYFLGINIYYIIVFFTILLLSIGIYLYLRNRFNGALLLLMLLSLPFMAGVIAPLEQGIIVLLFLPLIIYIQRRREPRLNWGAVLLLISYAVISMLPLMLRMGGDFTFRYYEFPKKDSLQVTRGKETFQLKDIKKKLAYDKKHRVILGHTTYELNVTRDNLSLSPKDPEKIQLFPDYKAIICNLNQVRPGENYTYLKFPHHFDPIPAKDASTKKRLTVSDKKGNALVLSKIVDENYNYYFDGLIYTIIIPFWLFLFFNYFGIPLRKRCLFRLRLFSKSNVLVYILVFFLLGLGYVVFGGLALYNNNYFKNFIKFRESALPLFVGFFFLSLVLSRYNRLLVFLYRAILQKKYHVPLITGLILIFLANYSHVFLYIGILFFGFVFLIRLRKDIIIEYRNSQSYVLNLKRIIEKPISSFEKKENQKILFGLGRVLYNKGWNYITVSDLLLIFALFFIVLQIFLGSELGVAVAGFLFLPIELGKVLLTLFFADWVSRIDKGMKLNVLWIYTLVLIPFLLLIIFLKDFSPLLVFSFVFFYHIIKIKKPLKLKLFLLTAIIAFTLVVVSGLSNYSLPFKPFAILVSIIILLFLIRLWLKSNLQKIRSVKRILTSLFLVFLLLIVNYAVFFLHLPAPRSLGSRVSSWLYPWQDYNLSYQYVNSLWLMKGTGTFGKGAEALTSAGHVPLVEKDLSFSLYISALGTIGTAFIFFTLLILLAYVHKLARTKGRWQVYVLEFLTVIFLAQFLVPALYVVGLLPIMGQPLPFLSYSNNMLLLFALPFSFLMIALGNEEER
jgi:cell division protein FtsW (lipid II flippase)